MKHGRLLSGKDPSPHPAGPKKHQAANDVENFLLTVVTINRNNATGLGRTIDSLACLRHEQDVQLVFVDGASTDNSLEVAQKLYRPEEIVSEPDRGIYDAMNKGLGRARGKYVYWLNSGDELSIAGMSDIRACLVEPWDIIAFAVDYVDPLTYEKTITCRPQSGTLPAGMVPHQGVFVRRSSCLEAGGYDAKFKIAADRDLLVKLYLSGARIQVHDKVVSRFFTGGVSSNKRELLLENLAISRKYGLVGTPRYIWRILRAYNEPLFGTVKRLLIGGS